MKCSFCGEPVPKGRGKILVKSSGQVLHFCGSKCDRNYSMGREGKRSRWTQTFRKFREKEGKKS